MTIDEAIAKYKDIKKTDANCPIHCMRSCDKCVQESEYIAEWLEELKDYRDKNKMVVHIDVENIESVKDKINKLSKEKYKEGYADGSLSVTNEIRNKVIDECLGVLYRNAGKIISIRFYEEIFNEMEKLKEG